MGSEHNFFGTSEHRNYKWIPLVQLKINRSWGTLTPIKTYLSYVSSFFFNYFMHSISPCVSVHSFCIHPFHSVILSFILFHENRASLSTGTVVHLQTSPCFLHPLNSAYLSVFSWHCLIPCLKFQHFILLARVTTSITWLSWWSVIYYVVYFNWCELFFLCMSPTSKRDLITSELMMPNPNPDALLFTGFGSKNYFITVCKCLFTGLNDIWYSLEISAYGLWRRFGAHWKTLFFLQRKLHNMTPRKVLFFLAATNFHDFSEPLTMSQQSQ